MSYATLSKNSTLTTRSVYQSIRTLAAALTAGADIVAPSYNGERGHPVGFARRHYAALSALTGDEGARAIVHVNRATLRLEATDDPGVLRDVDTRSQLFR